ncbi:MAG: hypothetical protein ACYCPQ_02415 [Elusimicrobiota bacterium]
MDAAYWQERRLWILTGILCLPAALTPNYNHDLFWHLCAARWMWRNGTVPRADFLSWTKHGAPWVDFEWLAELAAAGIYKLGAMPGLLALKAFLVAADALIFYRLLALKKIKPPWRQAALVLWSSGMLAHCDLRPDLFSIGAFESVLWLLENRFQRPRLGVLIAVFFLFALWANVHAGFAAGLCLFAAYALSDAALSRTSEARAKTAGLGAAILGSFVNPYGIGPYRILAMHVRHAASISRYIKEWSPMPAANPMYWPFWVTLGLLLLAAAAAALKRIPASKIPWGLALSSLGLAFFSIRHARLSAYFTAPACLLAAALLQESVSDSGAAGRRAIAIFFAADAAFLLWVLPRLNWESPFNHQDLPRAAARFLAVQEPVFSSLKLYHPWEWGGYLGWQLRPWFRVFGDGRYIFHRQHEIVEDAFASARTWKDYIGNIGADGALLPNVDIRLSSLRRYPDKTLRPFQRPWFVFYMPRRRWALVYWDSRALIFVARNAVPGAWLAAHEYRYLHPGDGAAFHDALARGEIDRARLRKEEALHRRQLALFGAR